MAALTHAAGAATPLAGFLGGWGSNAVVMHRKAFSEYHF
jgi:hypothetical protein